MQSCIFCKITKGELPVTKVYEDEYFLALLDIEPVSFGHTLIIPKQHVVWMQEVKDETISEIFKLAKKLMQAMIKGIGCDYVSLSVSGTDVPHFHVHLIPRYKDDGLSEWPKKHYEEGEKEEVVKKITSML